MLPGSRKIFSPVKQQNLMQLVSQIWPIYFHKTTAQDKTKKTEVALSIERDVQPVHHAKNKKSQAEPTYDENECCGGRPRQYLPFFLLLRCSRYNYATHLQARSAT